jgi:hypothetical protein
MAKSETRLCWRSANRQENIAYLEAIPPPYPQKKHSAPYDFQNARPGGTTSAPAYPPQPYHTQATTRTLHIYYEDWKVSGVRIMDTDKVTELFKVKLQLKKPHLSIASARTGAIMGTATYHSFTSRIDTTVRGSPISILHDALWDSREKRSYVLFPRWWEREHEMEISEPQPRSRLLRRAGGSDCTASFQQLEHVQMWEVGADRSHGK